MNKNKELYDISISLQKFLGLYYGLYNDDLTKGKISHNDIKTLLPNLKRISFDKLSYNKQDLYTGKIVIVKDSFGNIAPYIVPKFESCLEVKEIDFSLDSKEQILENVILNEDLNTYQLSELCKKYKKLGKIKEYRIAYRLLKKKKDKGIKIYKKKKELLKGDIND